MLQVASRQAATTLKYEDIKHFLPQQNATVVGLLTTEPHEALLDGIWEKHKMQSNAIVKP